MCADGAAAAARNPMGEVSTGRTDWRWFGSKPLLLSPFGRSDVIHPSFSSAHDNLEHECMNGQTRN